MYMKSTAYCEVCNKDVEYKIVESIKGKEIQYKHKIAVCNECDEILHINEISDENIEAMYLFILSQMSTNKEDL